MDHRRAGDRARGAGRNTNAIWWAAPAPTTCSASAPRADRALPGADLRGERADAYAVTSATRLRRERVAGTACDRRRLPDPGREVVRHDRRRRRLLHRDGQRRRRRRPAADAVPGGPRHARGSDLEDPPFTHNYPHGHPTLRFDVRCPPMPCSAARRCRPRGRAAEHMVRRGALPHRGPLRRGDAPAARRDRRLGAVAGSAASGSTTSRASRSRSPTPPPTHRRPALTYHLAQLEDDRADPKLVHARPRWRSCTRRGRRGVRRPLRAGSAGAAHAHERRRAVPARAARRPHLGGHERDPAPDRRPRPRKRGVERLGDMRDLTPLFEPRSVALVGASNDRMKWGGWFAISLLGQAGPPRRSAWCRGGRGRRCSGSRRCRRCSTSTRRPTSRSCRSRRWPCEGCRGRGSRSSASGLVVGDRRRVRRDGGRGPGDGTAWSTARAAGMLLLGPNCLGRSTRMPG